MPRSDLHRRVGLVVVALLLFVTSFSLPMACGQSVTLVSVKDVSWLAGRPGARSVDYDAILGALVALVRDEIGLPVSKPTFLLYENRAAFESHLVNIVRFDPVYAREVAGWAVAVGASNMVLANEEALERLPWSERIRVLAHELVHTVQYGLAGGRRGTSDQWLREGFADWIAYRVLESLDLEKASIRQALLVARIKGTARRLSCAPLSELVTLDDLMKSRTRAGGTAVYGQCFLAVDSLIKRHGVQPVVDYFGMFKRSDDRLGNFEKAFGEDLPAFEKAHLARLQDEY